VIENWRGEAISQNEQRRAGGVTRGRSSAPINPGGSLG